MLHLRLVLYVLGSPFFLGRINEQRKPMLIQTITNSSNAVSTSNCSLDEEIPNPAPKSRLLEAPKKRRVLLHILDMTPPLPYFLLLLCSAFNIASMLFNASWLVLSFMIFRAATRYLLPTSSKYYV